MDDLTKMSMDRWKGRVALVTGASAGIGAELCRVLAAHGMRVVGCARAAHKIPTFPEDQNGGSILAIKCDLTSEEDISRMFDEIRAQFGRLDLCVNNAGLSHDAPLISTDEDAPRQWKNMLDVNIMALCICTREAVKLMRENNINDGQILHIGSMSGHRMPNNTLHMYIAIKCMVKSLAEGLRRELRAEKSSIKVACISPGPVATEFVSRCYQDDPDKERSISEACQFLKTEDIAEGVLHILRAPPHVDIHDILVRPTAALV